MPYLNQDVLKDFLGENHFIADLPDIDKYKNTIAQVEDIIFQHTLIPIPTGITLGNKTLQNYACILFLWFTTAQTDTLEMWQYQRLKKMYDDTMDSLKEIKNGKTVLYDKDGNPVETGFEKTSTFYVNNNRTERL